MAEMRLREAISRGLREALDADDSVFLMGEDIGDIPGRLRGDQGIPGGIRPGPHQGYPHL